MIRGALSLLVTVVLAGTSQAEELSFLEGHPTVYAGPYEARVTRMIDADTLEMMVFMWPGQVVVTSVRVAGIDTPPTLRGAAGSDCDEARDIAARADEFVAFRYFPGKEVRLVDIRSDKYAGRVVADVQRWRSDRWLSLSRELLDAELALPYDGGTKPDWCGDIGVEP